MSNVSLVQWHKRLNIEIVMNNISHLKHSKCVHELLHNLNNEKEIIWKELAEAAAFRIMVDKSIDISYKPHFIIYVKYSLTDKLISFASDEVSVILEKSTEVVSKLKERNKNTRAPNFENLYSLLYSNFLYMPEELDLKNLSLKDSSDLKGEKQKNTASETKLKATVINTELTLKLVTNDKVVEGDLKISSQKIKMNRKNFTVHNKSDSV
ncbi:hypothetical protein C1646_812007 [Rhizophagus diaphanus]|nr:hypothetical protein C1646_812007 [Rhizophagus diaphanus] [Rhizophagus sp. MUCL 43196]